MLIDWLLDRAPWQALDLVRRKIADHGMKRPLLRQELRMLVRINRALVRRVARDYVAGKQAF